MTPLFSRDLAHLKASTVSRSCVSLAALLVTGAVHAQVVPSGATATSAATAANGHVSVTIAPPNSSGISANQYNNFNVGSAGVGLYNQGVNATTIINQVTSSNRSNLNGPLSVVGPAAHVIVANPNGITVNGGSFINTGGVALSTGTVSYAPSTTFPGTVNTVLSTGNGDILVTGAGLSGSMTSLQLIAAKMKIDGPITNSHPDPNADITLTAGNANVTLDSSVVPGTTIKGAWASGQSTGGSSNDILIDVTPNGSFSASKILMSVSAKGAGVSFAGSGQAAIGDFNITANGKVSILGGTITAKQGSVKIVAPAIDVLNSSSTQAQITSVTGGVTLLANAGGTGASGDINVQGEINGNTRNTSDPDSKGGVTLNASGNISLLSQSVDRLAIVFSSKDDLVVNAGGNITSDTGRFLSNNRTFVTAGGTLSNIVDPVGAVNNGNPILTYAKGHHPWWSFGLFSTHFTSETWDAGSLRIPNQLAYIVGQSVFIQAGNVINSGEIDAQSGALEIDTGLLTITGDPVGSAFYSKRCGLTCASHGSSNVSISGGTINSATSMQLNASSGIINNGGQVTAYGNMGLNAPSIVGNASYVTATHQRPGGLYNMFSGPTAFIFSQNVGGTFSAPMGSINIVTSKPVSLNGGAITAADGVTNPAGINQIAPAKPISNVPNEHIGVLRGIWE